MFRILLLVALLAHCTHTPRRPTPEVARLGKELFFDPRLSSTNDVACATCHIPALGFTNGKAVGTGVHGRRGDRNVPTLLNRAGSKRQFWDMRAPSLEEQVLMVLQAEHEMGVRDLAELESELAAIPEYARRFREVFGRPPNRKDLAAAIAAYERTLDAGASPYDRYLAGDRTALNASQLRGKELFFSAKFRCDSCHSGSNFTDERLRPRCYPFTSNLSDFLNPVITKEKMFKTPTLRNLKYTAPYMHSGAFDTLEEAVEFYTPSMQVNAAGDPDPKRPPVTISAEERRALVDFLLSLSGDAPYIERL